MDHLLEQLNAPILYALVGGAILLVVAMCVTFMVKSWRAGLRLGMDRAVLKKTVISSATFTLLPAFSILLGVIALSGSLGIPLPWLRLSVIGNLQYEVNVAEIAATGIGPVSYTHLDVYKRQMVWCVEGAIMRIRSVVFSRS